MKFEPDSRHSFKNLGVVVFIFLFLDFDKYVMLDDTNEWPLVEKLNFL